MIKAGISKRYEEHRLVWLPAQTVVFIFLLTICNVAQAQVKIWEEPMVIPTWEIGAPEINPAFPWSSSRRPVYPYPYLELLTDNQVDKTYQVCWLENEFIKLMVLPEIGGPASRCKR